MNLEKPISVQTVEALNKRLPFHPKVRKLSYIVLKGYEGEYKFGLLLKEADFPNVTLYDTELQNGIYTQSDFIVITSRKIYLLDIKNHEGIYYYKDGDFIKNGDKINNLLTQLNRAYDVLDILLKRKNIQLPIEKKLIFINPSFTLYGNHPDLPIILHSQLENYLTRMKREASDIGTCHNGIATYIKRCKVNRTSYDTEISYRYDQLLKGIWCGRCNSTNLKDSHRYFTCMNCHYYEFKVALVRKCAKEFYLLFPEASLTPSKLNDWCGNRVSTRLTGQVLREKQHKH